MTTTRKADAGKPIDLVYIASTGRAGSTLLEMLLNAHSSIASCGELQIWPRELTLGRGNPCGCGRPVVECPFWKGVQARVDPLSQPEPRIDHFRSGWRGGRVYRRELIARMLAAPAQGTPSPAEGTYGANHQALLAALGDVWEEHGGRRPRWLVDASKDPYRLFWLLRCGLFRIKTIHLVRDPRGYACSAAGVGRRPLSRPRRLRAVAVQAAVWRLQNHLVREVLARHAAPADHCTVTYESLASAPEATLRRVCTLLDCAFEPGMIAGFRDAPVHAISGNAMRFERRGIELDESHRRSLSAVERAAALTVSRVPARWLLAALSRRDDARMRA